jgi:glucokinase
MHYIGLDIGGTTIKGGLIDETGRVLEALSTPTVINDLDGLLSKLTELIHNFQKSVAIDAVGIGIPGLRSSKTGIIETAPHIPCLNRVNVEDLVANQVHLRVVSENDANAGAYAEFVCGAGVGIKNMVYLTLGTGLGSGLILNGSLFVGGYGFGGELGHTTIDPEGRMCACGNRGCLETIVSATGIVMTAQEKMKNGTPTLLRQLDGPLTSEMIFDAAGRGDAVARATFEQTGKYLGIACANLINLLNPEMIVIGGGVMASGEMLLHSAIEEVHRRAFAPSARCCEIVQSRLWPEAGMIGAAMLARDR